MSETETWHALSTSRDPDNELRMFKTRNARITGIGLTLYAANEVVAKRIVAQTLKRLELDGVRIDGRWIGCSVERLAKTLHGIATWLGSPLVTPGERLQQAILKVDAQAQRAEKLAGNAR